jgi:precorrin-4/cobalt-precorrin-4 C11-methyltransferase
MQMELGVDKTALILTGAFLDSGYERSKLYDPLFSHGFRNSE